MPLKYAGSKDNISQKYAGTKESVPQKYAGNKDSVPKTPGKKSSLYNVKLRYAMLNFCLYIFSYD